MPYKVIKAGKKFAVHKLDAGGKPAGKALGTHDTAEKASAQMKALYASEKKTAKKELEAEPTGELVTKDGYGGWEPEPIPVKVVENEEGTTALTFADLMAQAEANELAEIMANLTDQFSMLACNVMQAEEVTDKATALKALATEYQSLLETYIKHEETEETPGEEIEDHLYDAEPIGEKEIGWLGKLKQLFFGEPEKEAAPEPTDLFIWKEGSTYRWIAAYSNNRQDDEQEIISNASHKEFDQALHNKEWQMPEVYLWHIPYPVGRADYHAYDESTGFPVAAGHFYAGMEWAAEGVLKEKWTGVSHGMPEKWIQYDPQNSKVITRHRTKEITFLPLWAAANKLAFSIINKEQSMSEVEKGLPAHKRDEFIKAFGEERVKQIEAALADKSKEADEAGIQKKETSQEAGALTQADLVKALEVVLDKVKEGFDVMTARIEALETEKVKEADQFDILAQLKAKSIIGAPAARVDGRSSLAKDAPEETPGEKQQGPTPVGLLNNIFAANQAWNERGGRR